MMMMMMMHLFVLDQ